MILLESSCSYSATAIEETNKEQQKVDSKMKESNGLCEGCFSALQRLERLKNACLAMGWDGEEAKVVSLISHNNAWQFLFDLPLGIIAPDPGIDVNGQMTLEWRRSDGRLLSLTFDDQWNVHYIAFLGSDKIYGTRPVSSGYSDKLKDFLEDVIKE